VATATAGQRARRKIKESQTSHYAWGGRLCLHPFNLGFRIALSHDNEIPNLKEYLLSRCDSNGGPIQNRDLRFGAQRPNQIAI